MSGLDNEALFIDPFQTEEAVQPVDPAAESLALAQATGDAVRAGLAANPPIIPPEKPYSEQAADQGHAGTQLLYPEDLAKRIRAYVPRRNKAKSKPGSYPLIGVGNPAYLNAAEQAASYPPVNGGIRDRVDLDGLFKEGQENARRKAANQQLLSLDVAELAAVIRAQHAESKRRQAVQSATAAIDTVERRGTMSA